jgi:hypothetical protein
MTSKSLFQGVNCEDASLFLVKGASASVNPRSSISSLKSSCYLVGRSRGFNRD